MGIGSSTLGTLSDDELRHVKASWKVVMENEEETGIFIFKTFLEKHNYYKYFRKFAAVPVAELSENRVFKNHAQSIMQTIDEVVRHVKSQDLRSDLVELGRTHKDRNVSEQQFKELKAVIINTLEMKFKLPVETLHAWNKAFDISYVYVFEGLSQGDSKN